jgi:fructose-1,6-bisphosphatase
MDAYLAGGAISSLFTNRKINDFDIYFQKEGDVHEVEK